MARTQASLRWAAPAALLLFSAFHLADFLGEGLPTFFDGHSHVARTWFAAQAFAAGHYPAWSWEWYGGYRLLAFYAPAYYWLTGLVSVLTGDPIGPTKWLSFSAQCVATLGVYAFALRLGARPVFAALAGLLWVTCEPRAMLLGRNANYPTLFVYTLLPWLSWWVAGYVARSGSLRRLFAGQALWLAGMSLGHLANALLALPGFLAFEVLWLRRRLAAPDFRRALLAVAGSLAVLPLLIAFALLPLVTEVEHVSLFLDRGWPFQPAGWSGLAWLAGAPVEPGAPAVEVVRAVVAFQGVGPAVEVEVPSGDPVRHASRDAPEVRRVLQVAFELVEAQHDVDPGPRAVGNPDRANGGPQLDELDAGAAPVLQGEAGDGLVVGCLSEGRSFDSHRGALPLRERTIERVGRSSQSCRTRIPRRISRQ